MNYSIKKPVNIPVGKLKPFDENPYKVQDNDEMNSLITSIQDIGITEPILVRPIENTDEYEVISGHRRLHAAEKAGLETVPALIYAISRDEAAVMLVDSNLHREHILPSEKAFAYKLKLDAMSRQGFRSDLTSDQVGRKLETAEIVAQQADDSKSQVRRYIRLTHLIPELLAYMDEGKMALSVGVELSYLYEEHQRAVAEASEYYDCTPSYAQAVRLRKESDEKYCILTPNRIFKILGEEKANQREKVSFQVGDLRKYFPENYTAKEIQNTILRLLEQEHQRQHRSRDYER